MAYDFVADAEKLQDMHNDLVNTADNITTFIQDIYTKVNDLNNVWSGSSYDAFKARCESYRTNLEQLPDILNAFAVDLGTLGGDTNTMVVSIKALLDCSNMLVKDGDAGTRTVNTSTRAKDANGAYIPTTGDYSGGISIPYNTTLGEGEDCTTIGDSIYRSTMQTSEKLSDEIADLNAYKEAHLSEIMALPPAQREATLNYINTQIVERQSIIDQINTATTHGYFKNDGPIFNATSNDLTGNVVLGAGVSDQEAVDSSVAAAKSINNNVSELSSMSSIEAYMLDCGLDSIGG